jgi:hypothetical protein
LCIVKRHGRCEIYMKFGPSKLMRQSYQLRI